MPKVLTLAWEKFFKIQHAQPEDIKELLHELLEDLQIIKYLENSSKAITHDLPIEEPEYSLSMRDEHLSTISEMESDKLIKSSVENLVPIPSESEDFSDNKSDYDMARRRVISDEDVLKENFKIYSNPLFDDEIISSKKDPHPFNAESNLIESLLNRDILTVSYPKIDSFLEEFSGELAHINLIPPRINKSDFDPEEEIHLIEELLYDNSSSRPLEESNSEISDATIESSSLSPIPVEYSDSVMEEIDLFLISKDSIPPGIKSDFNSGGDIIFLDDLLNDDPIPEYERFTFDIEPNAAVINNFDELNEDKCFDPGGGEIIFSSNIEDDNSFTFVIRTFLSFLTYPEDSSLLLSTGSEDTIFDPVIST
ncbi:hypothetical protein Tco_0039264 [Tanacetum coccineum]